MLKRSFDILASGFALLVLSPIFVIVGLGLRFSGEGEIFYLQERVGRGGRPFKIFKFATMLKNSPNMYGGDITTARDPRILPMGGFLRATKINELPQLLNILNGTMSVIGPRPLTPSIAAMFPASYWKQIAHLRPGLSGISSIVFRDEEKLLQSQDDRQKIYRDVIVPRKMALELWYSESQSLLLDLKLIFLTVGAVVKPDLELSRWLRGLPPA